MKKIWDYFIKEEKNAKLVYVIKDNKAIWRVVVNEQKKYRGWIYTNGNKLVYQMLNELYWDYKITERYDLSIIKWELLVNLSNINIEFNDIRKINNQQIIWLLWNIK